MADKIMRCAIYTRKSSEEGLEQSFNSLNAQREACAAYILSQASEGWVTLPTFYDDGGYSGGSMERPGLKHLLVDIAARRVDIVVVYKIDRLTRSLADFARIVEVFEQADVSFVSVTQSFNTTSSMGRLMLNVLLSFAQFEREVTGERIRDKIAASKAKGLWMGGNLSLGYDLPKSGSRVLEVNEGEAATVRHIFVRYLELGSVHALERDLAREKICSKRWTTAKGKEVGGAPFSRGALFHLLRNHVYLGKIRHKDEIHEGEHQPIVDQDLFDQVQRHLDGNARRHRSRASTRTARAPLTGKLFDAAGDPMSPTTSRGKSGRAYRYYVSASLQQGRRPNDDRIRRLAAPAIERVITEALVRWLPQPDARLDHLVAVRLRDDGLLLELTGVRPATIATHLCEGEMIMHETRDAATIQLPLALPLRGGKQLVARGARRSNRPDPVLIAALRRAHAMLDWERGLPVMRAAPTSPYDRLILRLALLAPDMQADILRGAQPAGFNLEALKAIDIPLAWSQQRKALGWHQ
ncbi:recombinase family protein [Qipengyuania oceanensis]|uniref:Recombinase family protein n=1 Tax=Qipengyuania oceanensis TaxID=1463597 RepID=A0A844YHS4_9SPHN|nr:recombinase family protein [Qipengyuania oceanensis]MXO64070.1 recombinase family protein [Qipengyuania oceanensis]